MTEADIFHTLTGIFCDIFDLQSIVLTANTTAEDVPGWDSVNHITLVVETERAFGIKFQTTEIEDLKNVGDLVRLIKAKSNK